MQCFLQLCSAESRATEEGLAIHAAQMLFRIGHAALGEDNNVDLINDVRCSVCQALLELNDSNASSIFGWPDNLKLKSSMTLFVPTLFVVAAGEDSVFAKVLDKFFGGEYDAWTLNKLGR